MTAIKLEPIVKVLVYPYDAITRQKEAGIGVSDLLASNINAMAGGGGAGSYDVSFGSADQWAAQVGYDNLPSNVRLIRFADDGTVRQGASAFQGFSARVSKELAGFTLAPQHRFTNCITKTTPDDNTPSPDNEYSSFVWKPLQGEGWETYVPNNKPYRNFIRHRVQRADAAVRIRSKNRLAAGQGFSATIIWRGIAAKQTQKAGFRLAWADGKYSVVWRQSHGIELQKKVSGKDVTWKVLSTDAPQFEGQTQLKVEVVGGRLIVSIDDDSWWKNEIKGGDAVDFRLPAGSLMLSSFGVDAAINIATTDYLDNTMEAGQSAIIRRTVGANFDRTVSSTEGYVKGWHGSKTQMQASGSINHRQLQFVVAIRADRYETPLASAVMIDFPPNYHLDVPQTIDLWPAVMQMGYSGLQPGVTDTASISIEAFRSTLDALYPNWQDTVKPFAPVTVDVRWKYRDDLTGAITIDDGYVRLFEGYITAPDMSSDKVNNHHLSIKALAPATRLKKPAGFIDNTYLPLDYKLLEKGTALYGCECVQFLIGRVLGENIAGTINGNGDPFRFLRAPYPLLGTSALAGYRYTIEPPSGSGFYLPAPFGSHMMDWVQTIARYDRCVFFWGHSPDDPTGASVPIYGRIEQIFYAGYNQPLEIADSVEEVRFANNFFESVALQNRPEKMYNDFVVWGPSPTGADGILPSYFNGRARLPESEESWPRTLLTQLDYIAQVADAQPLAEAIANGIASQFDGSRMQEVTLSLPKGNAALRWGMKVQLDMKSQFSDAGMNLDGVPLRIERVDHQFNAMRDSPSLFKTSITCRSLSATGF